MDVVNILISLEECGIFHNDVKDENIIIDLDTSKVTLIDFGSGVLRHEGDDDIITHFEGMSGVGGWGGMSSITCT